MSDQFSASEKLPIRITPCPIIEAIFEVRFVPSQPWENIAGLLYARIREKYPEQKKLSLMEVPAELLRQQPAWLHQPLIQFFGTDFMVQIGHQMVGLAIKPHHYPGWERIREELIWLIDRLKEADFMQETERIGVRYIDFIEGNLFSKLNLNLQVGSQAVITEHTDIATIMKKEKLTIRLAASNAAIIGTGDSTKTGSVLDIDGWYGALDADLFENGIELFTSAHHIIKRLFFELMKPDYLRSLNPEFA